MYEVEVSETAPISPEVLRERLSPRAIIECTGIFDVEAHETRGETEVFVVDVNGLEMTLAFSAVENGYEYQVTDDSGLFKERYSRITVEGGTEARIHAKTEYTLDSVWAFLLNRMAAKRVREELEILVENLINEATAESSDGRESTDVRVGGNAPRDEGTKTGDIESSGGSSQSSQNSSSG